MKTQPEIRQKAAHFIRNNNVMALATMGENGMPQVAVVYYAVDHDFNFYVSTRKKTRKFKNILDNSNVSFVVGVGPRIITVQGGGKAEWSQENANKLAWSFIENFDAAKASPKWPIRMLPHKDAVIIKIKPQWMAILDLEDQMPVENYEGNYRRIL